MEAKAKPVSVSEQKAVTRAVHRLHAPLGAFNIETKHVVLVQLCMTGNLPELQIENVWCNHLFVASLPVLLTNEIAKLVVYTRAVWKPKTRPRRELVEKEKLLLGANKAVVPLFGLLLELEVLLFFWR
jgi:hypothetical protein